MSTCFVSLSPSTPNIRIHTMCVMMMCVPLTLELYSWAPTQLAICNWKLVKGALEQRYIYELPITSLSLSCLFVAIETGGRGCGQDTL